MNTFAIFDIHAAKAPKYQSLANLRFFPVTAKEKCEKMKKGFLAPYTQVYILRKMRGWRVKSDEKNKMFRYFLLYLQRKEQQNGEKEQ